jgi:hypothetical protein
MPLSTTITLERGATSITLTAPEPGYAQELQRAQAMAQDATGEHWVYDKGVTTRKVIYVVTLTAAQRQDLDDFFHATVIGGYNTFTLTDHHGTAHSNCRFATTRLQYTKTDGARWIVELPIVVEEDVE